MRRIQALFIIASFFFFFGCQTIQFTTNPDILTPKLPKPTRSYKLAVVLGGGGSKGLAHVGVLEALEEAGLKPDLIVGCSSGAVVGSMYAAKQDTAWLKKILIDQRATNFFEFDFVEFGFSLSTNTHLKKFLNENLPVRAFEKLKIPFVSVATNLQTGKLVPFFKGQIIPALLASSAVPGVFRPIEIYGTYFVDGGVVDPVPVQVAKKLGADVVVAVEIGQKLSPQAPNNLFDIMWRSLSINYRVVSEMTAKFADVNIDVPLGNLGMFSDQQNKEVYMLGKATAKRQIPKIKKLLRNAAK